MTNIDPTPPIPAIEVVNVLSSSSTRGEIRLSDGRVVPASYRLTGKEMIEVAERIEQTFVQYQQEELQQIRQAVDTRLKELNKETSTLFKKLVLWFRNKLATTQAQQKAFESLATQINSRLNPRVSGTERVSPSPLAGRGGSPSAPSPSLPSPTRGSPTLSPPPPSDLPFSPTLSPPPPSDLPFSPTLSPPPPSSGPPPPPMFTRAAQPSKVHREFANFILLPRLPGEPPPPAVPEGYDLGELRTTRSSASPLKALDQMDETLRTEYAAQLAAYAKGLNQAIQKMEERVEVRRLQALPKEIQETSEQLTTELGALKESRMAHQEAQSLSATLPVDGQVVMQYTTAKGEQRSWAVVHEAHPDYQPFFTLKHRHVEATTRQKELLSQAATGGIAVKDLQPSAITLKIGDALKQAKLPADVLAATPDQLAVRQEVIEAGLDPSKLDQPMMRGSMLNKDQAKRYEPSPSQRAAVTKLRELGMKEQEIQVFTSHQNALAQARAMGLDVSIFDQVRELQQEIDTLKTAGVDVEAIFNHSIEQKIAYHQKEAAELEQSYQGLRATLREKMAEEATYSTALLEQRPYSEWTQLIATKKKWAKDLASKAEQLRKVKGSAAQESQGPSKKELAERDLAARYSPQTIAATQQLLSVEATDRNAALGGQALLQRARPPSPMPSQVSLSEMINRGELTLEELRKLYPTLEGEMKREATALLYPRLDFPPNLPSAPSAEGGIPPPPPPPLPPRWK